MSTEKYESFVRDRITELRLKMNVSEHRMSLELGKSGAYIRNITSGIALPSLKELFRIMEYLEVEPPEFFEPLQDNDSLQSQLNRQLHRLNDEQLAKVNTFIQWMK